MQDYILLKDSIEGDSNSLGLLINKYSKYIYSLAFTILKDKYLAQDVVQDTFIIVFDNIKKFKGEAKFSTWIYRIAVNRSLQLVKKNLNFDIEKHNNIVENIEEEDFDNEEINNFRIENLNFFLSQLNTEQRLLIDLFYYKKSKIKDIALVMQTSESNIKTMLHRIRKKLKNLILNI